MPQNHDLQFKPISVHKSDSLAFLSLLCRRDALECLLRLCNHTLCSHPSRIKLDRVYGRAPLFTTQNDEFSWTDWANCSEVAWSDCIAALLYYYPAEFYPSSFWYIQHLNLCQWSGWTLAPDQVHLSASHHTTTVPIARLVQSWKIIVPKFFADVVS